MMSMAKPKRTVKRPWGSFNLLERGRRFWIKEIKIKEGNRLSKQFHKKRSEIWLVLKGTILAEVDGRTATLKENKTIFIKRMDIHRASNVGTQSARILEFAFGDCKEDDIVRLEDDFGR